MLKLSANVDREPARCGIGRDAIIAIKSFLIGSAIIVDDRLAEMVAVIERPAAYAGHPHVRRFQANDTPGFTAAQRVEIRLKFFL